MPEWNAPLDALEVERLELIRAIRYNFQLAHERVAQWEPRSLEQVGLERLEQLG